MLEETVALGNKPGEQNWMQCTLLVNPQLSRVEIIDILVYATGSMQSHLSFTC